MTFTGKIAIRKFAYAALLLFTTLNFAPTLASGQDSARGHFTLSHAVRWDNITVPAGEYRFSIDSNDAPRMMTLTKLDRARESFLLMVHASDEEKVGGDNRLVLNKTNAGVSWVRAMQLAQFGITLFFGEPSTHSQGQIVRVGTMAGGQ